MKRTTEENIKINCTLDMARSKCGLELTDFSEIDFDNDTTRDVMAKILARVAEIEFMELEDMFKDHKMIVQTKVERQLYTIIFRPLYGASDRSFTLQPSGNWIGDNNSCTYSNYKDMFFAEA